MGPTPPPLPFVSIAGAHVCGLKLATCGSRVALGAGVARGCLCLLCGIVCCTVVPSGAVLRGSYAVSTLLRGFGIPPPRLQWYLACSFVGCLFSGCLVGRWLIGFRAPEFGWQAGWLVCWLVAVLVG